MSRRFPASPANRRSWPSKEPPHFTQIFLAFSENMEQEKNL